MILKRHVLIGGLLAALLAGAPSARADLIIGVALPRTGSVAAIGDQVFNGATAAVRDINAKGGVNSEKLALDIQDDVCDPKQAVSVANKFLQSGVKLVVGHVCSGASIVASEVYAENGMVMISPASNSARLTDRGLPGIFRVCGRDDQQGQLSAEIIRERFPGKKVAILHDNTPFSRGLADATKANLKKAGVTEVLFNSITPGERDYTAVITRLKAAGIELVYYGGYHQEMGLLVRQGAEQGFGAQWLGTSGIASKEFAAIAGPAANGVLMTFNPDPRKREEAAAVVGAFRAQGIDPEGFTLYGYAAVQALTQAAEKARAKDPRSVEKALKSERFDLLLGPVGFDGKGDITVPGYVLYVWKDGAFGYAN